MKQKTVCLRLYDFFSFSSSYYTILNFTKVGVTQTLTTNISYSLTNSLQRCGDESGDFSSSLVNTCKRDWRRLRCKGLSSQPMLLLMQILGMASDVHA